MEDLFIGIGRVTIYLRSARSLKDRRSVVNSLKQRLRGIGFSVTECGSIDNPKHAVIGFCYSGYSEGLVDKALNEGMSLFSGNYEVTQSDREIIDYAYLSEQGEQNDDKYGYEDED